MPARALPDLETTRWKPVLHNFAVTFGDRWSAAEKYQIERHKHRLRYGLGRPNRDRAGSASSTTGAGTGTRVMAGVKAAPQCRHDLEPCQP